MPRNIVELGGIDVHFRSVAVLYLLANFRMTQEQTGHLTSLYSIGSALLYFAVDILAIEELKPWKEVEKGNTEVLEKFIRESYVRS